MTPLESQGVNAAALRVASRTTAPTLVVAQPALVAVAEKPPEKQSIAAAAPTLVQASLTPRIQDLKMIEPDVAGRISAMPSTTTDGVTRQQLSAPMLQGDFTDTSVLEDPKEAAKKYFVMGYAVAEENTTAGRRFAVRMLAKDRGWELSVTLAKVAPDEIVRANPGALELPHRIVLLLQYKQRVNGVLATLEEIPFTRTTVEGSVARGTLTIESLAKRDEIYEALTDKDFDATLIVRRAARVAVPATPVVKFTSMVMRSGAVVAAKAFSTATAAPAELRLMDIGIVPPVILTQNPQPSPPPPPPPLFRETERVLDLRLKFFFDATLHGYLFEGLGTIVPGASRGLQRTQVSWDGRSHSYYQDDRSRNLFYYLPDTFKIARRPEAPHRPLLSAAFESKDGSRDALRVAVTYCAVPIVTRERLSAALPSLKSLVPPEILATAPLQLEPLLPDPAQVRLKLAVPGSDAAAGPFTERKGAAVDLRAGVVDAVTQLTLDEFRGLFESLFSEGQLLFTGSVSFQLGNIGEEIPFQLRIYDTAEPLAGWTQASSGDATTVTVTNPIESPLRIRRINAIVADGTGSSSRPLDAIDGALPIDVPPAGSARFRLSGPAGATVAGVDLSGMQTLPARDAIFNLVLDPTTRAEYQRPIKVKTFPQTFAARADAPQQQVLSVVVDFDDGSTVELTANQLEVPATVPVPVVGFVLGTEARQTYRYKVTVVRLAGPTTDADWRTGESGILFPAIA
jgi:hypothetical protein